MARKTQNKATAEHVHTRMNHASELPTYAQAKHALNTLEKDLAQIRQKETPFRAMEILGLKPHFVNFVLITKTFFDLIPMNDI